LNTVREILYGDRYHEYKGKIMSPIDEFFRKIETRTAGEVSDLRAHSRRLTSISTALVAVTVLIGLALAALVLGWRVTI